VGGFTLFEHVDGLRARGIPKLFAHHERLSALPLPIAGGEFVEEGFQIRTQHRALRRLRNERARIGAVVLRRCRAGDQGRPEQPEEEGESGKKS
jgi:hypothetical protein